MHHHQNPAKRQLVLTEVHGPTKHTGGRKIWEIRFRQISGGIL
ncbi:HNH endonuclease [Thermoactinomyces intermedius]|uniref:HNH endonuclease n=1 Tax=Thermoactinomyces intermedius TaxID=2024 RepID=A0A8I1A8F2_THEIN|nr:HNH endonuclease [Thermoactinomyces intermedius]MBA4836802.1 HNH endonuclease [Thermoactinomyces intermedius]MBH8594606.1 HNH endonuclease [Thermoactinomyces intermedius]MBH8602147.1 HNH endonuclease [Thermoactinomyces sp. CICC 23799]